MSTWIATARRWSVPVAEHPRGGVANVSGQAQAGARGRLLRKTGGLLDDTVVLLLVVFLFPLFILVVGTPIALLVRFVIEIAHRF